MPWGEYVANTKMAANSKLAKIAAAKRCLNVMKFATSAAMNVNPESSAT
jgi:hypothetical protein